jgi:hypothetical protein
MRCTAPPQSDPQCRSIDSPIINQQKLRAFAPRRWHPVWEDPNEPQQVRTQAAPLPAATSVYRFHPPCATPRTQPLHLDTTRTVCAS